MRAPDRPFPPDNRPARRGRAFIAAGLLAGTVMGALFAATPVYAQATAPEGAPAAASPASPSAKGAKTRDKKPYVILRAEEANYDQKKGIVTARGKVEIAHNMMVLRADTVVYDEKADKVSATGNVVLLESTGDVKFFDHAEFTNSMKDGVVDGFRMLMQDNSRLVAARGTRTGGVITTLEKAVFSPCDLCKDDPSRAPLWRVRAARVIHDSEKKDVEYKDAVLELYGMPVFYTPYLSHPDPTVKRRTGLLAPSYGSDSDFGGILKTPYFWEISPSEDMTLTPQLMTNQSPMLAGNYRRRFSDAVLEIDASGTQAERENATGSRIGGSDTRGHFFAKGTLNHDSIWRSKLKISHASDDTYLRRYKFPEPEQATLVTSLNTEGFKGRNYAQLSAYSFQGLRATDDPGASPLVLPYAEYHYISDPESNGAYLTANSSLLAITRDEGTDMRRLALDGAWNLPYTAWTGEVYSLSASLRGDLYSVDQVEVSSGNSKSGVTGRVMPQLMAQWRYPFVSAEGTAATQMIEPIAAVVVAPGGGNPTKIPNEDSLTVEFDDTNLFDPNRFSGVDRFDGGQRFIYGVNWGLYGNAGGTVEAFAGQSHSLKENADFSQSSGLDDKASDIVGRLRVSPGSWLDLLYRVRYDPDAATAQRHQFKLSTGPKALRFGVNYLFINETTTNSEFTDREQLILSLSAKLTKTWSATGYLNEDLGPNGGPITQRLALTYVDECFTFQVQGTRNFTTDRDLKPSDSLMFMLIFKHLGEFTSSG